MYAVTIKLCIPDSLTEEYLTMAERHHWKLLFPQVHYHFRNTGSTIPLHLFFLADKAT